MPKTPILPLGFAIRVETAEDAVMLLTDPRESKTLKPGTPVTIWRYSAGHLALGKSRGTITEVGYATAKFVISETETDARWPDDQDVILPRIPVFLALEGTFEPDPSRTLTEEMDQGFRRKAARHPEGEGQTDAPAAKSEGRIYQLNPNRRNGASP